MTFDYRIEPLTDHDRSQFSSGDHDLDTYFRAVAGQDLRRRFTTAFVAVEATRRVIGFYTLSATSILMDALPEEATRKLPRYGLIPAVLIGRLAISHDRQRQGLGAELLFDALARAAGADVGAHMAVVHPKNPEAGRFYEHHGFRAFVASPGMFLPLAAAQRAAPR